MKIAIQKSHNFVIFFITEMDKIMRKNCDWQKRDQREVIVFFDGKKKKDFHSDVDTGG